MKTQDAVILCFFGALLVTFSAQAQCIPNLGTINGGVQIVSDCPGDVTAGDIDGASTAIITSDNGNVRINGQINGRSYVQITAQGDCYIRGPIDGASRVVIFCNGTITIDNKIDGASAVSLHSNSSITINGKIDNPSTCVFWSGTTLNVRDGIANGNIQNSGSNCP